MTTKAFIAPDAQPLKAALWMIGAIFSFTSMAVAGRAVSLELDTFEIMTYRSFVGVFIVVAAGWGFGTLGQITRRSLHVHALRNVSHFTGQNLWFFAITAAPLAQVFAMEFSSPLWVALLAPVVLQERMTRTRALAALAGFIGILIVARPTVETMNPGLIAAACAAVGFAGSAIFTRLLTRTETLTCILFYMTAMQAVFGLVCGYWDGEMTMPSATSLPWIVVIGCAGLLAHTCLTMALSLAPATVVMPIDFARLPIIALVGMTLYAEVLDPMVFVGAAIIFAANYLNILVESRRR
ncbi:DMT family transporter [Anianabacter salinae]|uniref:DMT family transporter n=1 Tax=Anianabacter salinae TaxID=2851023 RepID=UPI00225E0AF3|nr:DMT family transporter [Anianabacter salinae]